MAALANQPINREVIVDSINLLPILKGQKAESRHDFLIHQSRFQHLFAIRDGEWKLIMKAQGPGDITNLKPIALFHLTENLSESEDQNLINDPDQSQRVQSMMQHYKEHRKNESPTVRDIE